MNEVKVTMHKHSKAEENKEQGEVFVLPPNLLEELGIHLGTIETTRESTMEHQESDKDSLSRRKRVREPNQILSNTIENHHATTSETEPSIIRTANLMKESVLLSPTFNLNNATMQGELEIEENTHLGMKITRVNEYVLESFEITETGPPNLLPQPVSITNFENVGSAEASISTKDMIKVDESSHVPGLTYADTKESMYDEHADEAYSSDCSNSLIDKADVINISDVHFNNESKINKNKKINIISEEIIDTTQLHNMNKCCPPKGNNLIPVTMNTIIKTQYKNSISYGNTMNSNLGPDLITDCLKSTETFDQKINIFSAETENTLLTKNDNAIQQNPEMIDSSYKNESKHVSALNIQGNDKLMETCSVDSVDRVDVNKPDVLIETCNNPISSVDMLKEQNENTTIKKINAITFDIKWDCNEINSKYKNNENLTKAQYYDEEKIISSLSKCNGHAGNDSSFTKNNESEFNIKEQNIKIKSTHRISRKSSDGDTQVCTFQTKNKDAEHSGIQQDNENLKSENIKSQNETCRNIKSKPKLKPEFVKNADKVDLDKIKEIAKYLSQFAEIRKRKAFEMMNGRNTTKNTTGKKHSADSKLSFQGVEKPGGSMQTNDFEKINNIRTYARKRKCKSTITIVPEKYDIPTQSIDLCDKNSPNSCNETELCICDYFGALISYGTENVSEGICICRKSGTICTPDIIFSIYYEKSSVATIKEENDGEYPTVNGHENSMYNIMTIGNNGLISAVQKREHDLDDDVKTMLQKTNTPFIDGETMTETNVFCANQTSENCIDNCDSTTKYNDVNSEPYEIPATSKQTRKSSLQLDGEPPSKKRVLGNRIQRYGIAKESQSEPGIHGTVITNDSVHDEALGTVEKDLIKCGVCGRYMQSEDWYGHIESAHNYLAWQYGDRELDLDKTKDVRKHLAHLMKEFGGLKCVKCGLIGIKKMNYYMKHIERCNGFSEPHYSILKTASEPSATNVTKSSSDNRTSGETETINKNIVQCGVCKESMTSENWFSHIELEHNYLAWKYGEGSLDVSNDEAIRQHLCVLTKKLGGLKCAKCGVTRKYVKSYMTHIESCDGLSESQNASALDNLDTSSNICQVEPDNTGHTSTNVIVKNEAVTVNNELVKCGVCDESMCHTNWLSHIESQHQYLAWMCGEPVLDLNDDDAVQDHLSNLKKELLGLKCSKCGSIRKYAKAFLHHIKSCNELNDSQNEALDTSSSVSQIESVKTTRRSSRNCVVKNTAVLVNSGLIKCGVCDKSMAHNHWFSHIESRHCYLAWEDGKPELDTNDEEAVHEHLNEIAKQLGGLKCSKCGLSRKHVKAYLRHIQSCSAQNESSLEVESEEALEHGLSDSVTNESLEKEMSHENEAIVKCGVCANSMQNEDWLCHIKKEHNYLAWKCGETPLDVDNEKAVLEHLHDIMKKYGGLECSKCGISRKYIRSYLSHFKTCDGLDTQERDDDIDNSSQYEVLVVAESESSKVDEDLVKCGVCGQYMVTVDWMAHLAETHNYLAWKSGDNPLDVTNPVEVQQHLKRLLEELGSLVCSKCGVSRKYVKPYLLHIRLCDGSEGSSSDLPLIDISNSELVTEEVITPTAGSVPPTSQCGVCGLIVENSVWISHIVEQHDYLAWKAGETPLDVNDKDMVRQHLKRMAKECGALTCKHCGTTKKLAKTYLKHTETCGQDRNVSVDTANVSVDTANVSVDITNVSVDSANVSVDTANVSVDTANVPVDTTDVSVASANLSVDTANSKLDLNESRVDLLSGGTCGVCLQSVESGRWIHHIQKYHNYLAWRLGEKPLDVEDYTEINENLYPISKMMNGLTCNKCGISRKYVKVFLTHIKKCAGMDYKPIVDGIGPASGKDYECAMCQQRIQPSQWTKHAMKEHYNVTWIVGQTPIDIKNPNAVEKNLKAYGDRYGLKCTKCGISRASTAGFYAHIITCGKTEEETEMYKSLCDICNNTYLCIYKNQHIAMHRAQNYSRELKLKKLEATAQKDVKDEEIISGKRRAARKARSVIENYSNDLGKNTYKCETCDFGTEFEKELKLHKCEKTNEEDFSCEESSSADDEPSGDDSETLLTSEASDQEETEKKRFRHSVVTTKVPRIPFQVMHRKAYLLQADKDFCNAHFTDDALFPHWLSCEHEIVAECDLLRYLPPMEQSCKLKSTSDWMTLKRFEAIKDDGISIFVGACIICISWTPLRLEDIEDGKDNYLAVACHNDVDLPRYRCDETPSYENLIQIWTYNAGRELPRIVLGVAHDFGTVWSMDWCPSGARGPLPEGIKDGRTCRLGLLAVACSNGSAYIFSVPYPSTVVKEDKFVYKLKPVAELRMQMDSDRKLYQATAITWSKEKNHNIILVGYADGSTAYYDLNCDSPLLRKVDNNVAVYYPYHDERPQNSCITATDIYPSALGGGATVSACATGAELRAGGGRARYPGACHAAAFAPLWPAALLAGDVAIMRTTVNEVEWATPGRRCGGNSALAGCARCAGVAAAAPPTLRLLRPHPVHPEFNKQVIGLLEMSLIDKKDKKVTDELAVKIEPLTYADTVKIYGIVFRTARQADKETQQYFAAKPLAHYPERFPLADVRSMGFCPSRKYHNHLAIATHSGLLFFINSAL